MTDPDLSKFYGYWPGDSLHVRKPVLRRRYDENWPQTRTILPYLAALMALR